jgi:hypothetical protein
MPSRIAELEVARHQRELIFKPLEAHIFGAPEDAVMPAVLTTGTDALLDELPESWFDVGLINKDDAITWSREVEKATITAIGYRDPVRSDVTSDVTGLAFQALETNRYNIERHLMMDLSGIVPKPETGEVVIDQTTGGRTPRNRYLAIARDGVGADTIYVGKLLSAGETSEVGEQTWTDGEGALVWPTTINGMVDTDAGFSIRHFFGGPGWRALLEDAGFPAMPTTP